MSQILMMQVKEGHLSFCSGKVRTVPSSIPSKAYTDGVPVFSTWPDLTPELDRKFLYSEQWKHYMHLQASFL